MSNNFCQRPARIGSKATAVFTLGHAGSMGVEGMHSPSAPVRRIVELACAHFVTLFALSTATAAAIKVESRLISQCKLLNATVDSLQAGNRSGETICLCLGRRGLPNILLA